MKVSRATVKPATAAAEINQPDRVSKPTDAASVRNAN
ncbi:hypothetical protein D030_1378A, partial [Vibrio parahaemolyticus AQ3810]